MGGGFCLELRSDLTEMPALAEALERFCEAEGIGPETVSVVTLALEEIVTNLIEHGDGDRSIAIELAHDGAAISARIDDTGAVFDRLGIHLVTTLMDEVSYLREATGHVLVIRKATAS
jgi:serine/threonine-protein kinase RsbW